MDNKIDRETKKALVLEDNIEKRMFYEEYGQGFFDCPETIECNRDEEIIRNIETKLKEVPYCAILVDDFMKTFDERYLMQKLVDGKYGSKNKNTPIYSIPCVDGGEKRLPMRKGFFDKPLLWKFELDKQKIVKTKKKLLELL